MVPDLVFSVTEELFKAWTRFFSGKLLSDEQIRSISQVVAGPTLQEWLATPRDEQAVRDRVVAAQDHIAEATRLITELRVDLDTQTATLSQLLDDIADKRSQVEHYQKLAELEAEQFEPIRKEMQEALKLELVRQNEKNRVARRIATFIVWAFTLIGGAVLGAYMKDIVAVIQPLLAIQW